jgi:hypothetical protein
MLSELDRREQALAATQQAVYIIARGTGNNARNAAIAFMPSPKF